MRRLGRRATRSTCAISMCRPQQYSRCVCGARVELSAAPSVKPLMRKTNRRVFGARRSVWRATRSTYAISMRRPQSHSRCVCGARVELTVAPSATPLMRKRTSRRVIGASRLGRRATRLTYAIRMCRPQQYSKRVRRASGASGAHGGAFGDSLGGNRWARVRKHMSLEAAAMIELIAHTTHGGACDSALTRTAPIGIVEGQNDGPLVAAAPAIVRWCVPLEAASAVA